jgi:DNA-binding response OmpR family regulator
MMYAESDMARVLVADDSAQIRLLVRRTLHIGGYEVLEAADGEEALRVLRVERPDVAILDVVMPGLSGLDVCRAARDDVTLAATGIILLSANATSGHAADAGADQFVAKPFLPSELLAAVREVDHSGGRGHLPEAHRPQP